MKSRIQEVFFSSFKQIEIHTNAYIPFEDIILLADGLRVNDYRIVQVNEFHYIIHLRNNMTLMHLYSFQLEKEVFDVNPLKLIDDPDFDTLYHDDSQLGAIYSKKATTFRVWAPLASKVVLVLQKSIDQFYKRVIMTKTETGTFEAIVRGDLDSFLYQYEVTNFHKALISTDPYSFATLFNSRFSVVIDLNKKTQPKDAEKLPPFSKPTEAVIYELHIRDFTMDSDCHVINKGTFLGLTEEPQDTEVPEAMAYLKEVSPTHVQLLPIHDYITVDEDNIRSTYNWGYDPGHQFALENSLATDPRDPYSAINEFQTLVNTLHKNGIRVNVDIVYNHVYKYETSNLHKIVPFYYFRRVDHHKLSNGSFCGNEIASERKMASRLIVDGLLHLINTFDVDGFRFDILGLMDTKTAQRIAHLTKSIKSNFMLYGEGWLMPSILPMEKRATYLNALSLPDYGHFNDIYRDILKGKSWSERGGYLLDSASYLEGFEFVYKGSVVKNGYEPRFALASQSINYIESHDNETLFDYINLRFKDMSKDRVLRKLELMNVVNMFAFGVPFFHVGQEIGATKNNHHNTYNTGDELNMFQYDILKERYQLAKRFQNTLKLRRLLSFMHLDAPLVIQHAVRFISLSDDHKVLEIRYNENTFYQMKRFSIVINTGFKDFSVNTEEFSHYYNLHDCLSLNELPPTKSILLKESGYLILVKL